MIANYFKVAFRNLFCHRRSTIMNVFAWPVAFLAVNRWLQDFAYRVEIGLWMFVLAGALALVIALLTVSYQAIRASLSNPVEALRYE
jgi:putative ABC transport system permease protein